MEKIVIFSIAIMIGWFSVGTFGPMKPEIRKYKAEKWIKKTDKVEPIKFKRFDQMMDPH
jgi:hypothetical protein